MKCFFILIIAACIAMVANAQSVTNIEIRSRLEIVSAGSTNIVQNTMRLDGSSNKDVQLANALQWAFARARASGYTNTMDQWMKQDARDRAQEYARAQLLSLNATIAAKITLLLTEQSDLLSNSDITSLNTIANKAQ